jgi:hypothetical protein
MDWRSYKLMHDIRAGRQRCAFAGWISRHKGTKNVRCCSRPQHRRPPMTNGNMREQDSSHRARRVLMRTGPWYSLAFAKLSSILSPLCSTLPCHAILDLSAATG